MKKHTLLLIVVLVSLVCFMGCATTKGPEPVVYSFAEEGRTTAKIDFLIIPGSISTESVYFVDFEGRTIPAPAEGTRWSREISVPAGVPFKLNVYVVRDRHNLLTGMTNWDISGDLGLGGIILLVPIAVGIVTLPVGAIVATVGDRFKYVVFECPPLEAGESYQLRYNFRSFMEDELILTETTRGLFGNRSQEVHVQRGFRATLGERDKARSF